MGRADTVKLTEFLKRNAGEYLRSVLHYDGDDVEVEFVRDDVRDEYSGEDARAVVQELQNSNARVADLEDLYVHGELRCTLTVFRSGVEIHFPHADGAGTAVALDSQAFEDIYSFVGDCMTVLGMG